MARPQEPDATGGTTTALAEEELAHESDQAALALAPEAVADTLGEYFRAWVIRVKGGDSGILPVIVGLIAIGIVFQAQNSLFLSAGNLTNLLVQGATFMLLGMAEIFVLLLGEIDLSLGFVAGLAGAVCVQSVVFPRNWPWGAAVVLALLAATAIGALQGTIVTRLGVPSFVVTLAGFLFWEGLLINVVGEGGTIPLPPNSIVNDFANGSLSPLAGWISMGVIVALFAATTVRRDRRRRASGLVAPPPSLTWLKIVVVIAAGVVLVIICNTNRGSALASLRGVPWAVPIVLAVLGLWSVLLHRTRFGRYVYAIGGNAEGARRAGINVSRIRTACFALAGLTAGFAGLIYVSRLNSISTGIEGGTLVLYAVATAVIGGTSLFGGRGKPLHAVLGGLVIAAIYNGMGLLGMAAATQYMITALVLLAAVIVDSLARRGRGAVARR